MIFQLGGEHYGLDIHAVQEIVRMQSITPIPGADPSVRGITNLRGRVVPVIDLGVRCGFLAAEATPATRIVVVMSEEGMVGLTVDAVSEVIRIPGDCVELPGQLAGLPGHSFIRGIAKLPDRLVSLLDLEHVLPARTVRDDEPSAGQEAA